MDTTSGVQITKWPLAFGDNWGFFLFAFVFLAVIIVVIVLAIFSDNSLSEMICIIVCVSVICGPLVIIGTINGFYANAIDNNYDNFIGHYGVVAVQYKDDLAKSDGTIKPGKPHQGSTVNLLLGKKIPVADVKIIDLNGESHNGRVVITGNTARLMVKKTDAHKESGYIEWKQ